MRILGIDPGLTAMGWGVIEAAGGRLSHVASGTLRTGPGPLALRLLALHAGLVDVLDRLRPECAAVEETFVNRDGAATLKLGQARAVALLVPAQAGLDVAEYAPNAVKKAVVGSGHADKAQVAYMVRVQLPGARPAGDHAADALAVALCHAHHGAAGGGLAAALARATR